MQHLLDSGMYHNGSLYTTADRDRWVQGSRDWMEKLGWFYFKYLTFKTIKWVFFLLFPSYLFLISRIILYNLLYSKLIHLNFISVLDKY